MARPQTQTVLFPGPAKAIAAMKVLVASGMETSRISIQTWGHRIALRPRDMIGRGPLEEIVALGGEIISDPAMGLLTPAASTAERSLPLEAVG